MVKFFGTLLSLLNDGATVVDLGAGDGLFSNKLADAGLHVIAVDRKEPPERRVGVTWEIVGVEEWIKNLPSDFAVDGYLLKNILQFLDTRWVTDVLLPRIALSLPVGGLVAIETFAKPSEPPLKGHVSFFAPADLLVAFPGWKVEMEDSSIEDAKDKAGNPRRFHLTRIIVRKV